MNTLENQENIIAAWLKSHEAELIQTADYIFHHPELAYQETLSSKCLADLLEAKSPSSASWRNMTLWQN